MEAADALSFDVQPAPVRNASKAYDRHAGKARIADGGEIITGAHVLDNNPSAVAAELGTATK
jgi:hypothetical protein